ncbi:MAG: hypothetical protein CUN56_00245 [Phototrophicales bacterium]|nr:MAG: hypothetical protein CUN56_00245 [Phototrophicales bacterium]RMG77357.1 MAG: hypothetical protein D6711_01855 [Chloroflexota bacterium]
MIPNRAENVSQWGIDQLTVILLRQFKRLLVEQGVALTDAQMRQIGENVAANHELPAIIINVNEAIYQLVVQSLAVLEQWNLSFDQSLRTEMTDLPWETTADFLTLANEKVNAEIRITAGASLMILLGDLRHAQYAVQAIEYDLEAHNTLDVDAMIAKRALLHHLKISPDAADWLSQVRATLAL